MENADPLMIAVKLHRQGDLDGAENIYRAVLEVRPDNPDALRLMGLIARQRGDNNAAIGFLKKACAFQPLNAGFLVDYADALYAENRFDESAAVYERALTAEPGKAPTWYKSASANRGAGNCKAAMAHLLKAIECDPDFFDAYYNLGNCLREINAIDEALASFSEAKKLQPLSVPALSNYAEALQVIGRVDEAMECFRKAVSIAKERNAPAYSNLLLCMNYDLKYSPEEIYAEHARFGTLLSGIGRRQSFTGAMDPMPTLRLGYVSPDFCDHPVSRFIEPILMNHDRAGFEVYCYYGNARVDEVTRCLRLLPISWRNIHGVSDEDALTMIRDDRIDILVDLAGHTAGNRLPLFAQKPSPVQVSYCGYPNTTGLAEMDYYITDACLDSEKDAPLYTEKLLRVPDCFCCYMPPQNAPDIKDLPALTNRHISFGSLHPLTRLNVGVLNLWSAVLLAIPTARLLIVRDTLTNEAKKRHRPAARAAGARIFDALSRHRYNARYASLERSYRRLRIALDGGSGDYPLRKPACGPHGLDDSKERRTTGMGGANGRGLLRYRGQGGG